MNVKLLSFVQSSFQFRLRGKHSKKKNASSSNSIIWLKDFHITEDIRQA